MRTTKLPFLVAWGADDKVFKPALAERFGREIPNAKLVMIENCKALVCWDQPNRIAGLFAGLSEGNSEIVVTTAER